MGARLERRISDIESNVERKLTAKFNTVITERVKGEVNKVKEEVQTEIDDLKENFKRLDKTYAEIVSKEKIENVDIKFMCTRLKNWDKITVHQNFSQFCTEYT